MPWKKCVCGENILVPKKTSKNAVRCPYCGASAPLKKRNGRVRGLKHGFNKSIWD
jgi:DNA-directed RNA polymerase subunit RPC12/RpoP